MPGAFLLGTNTFQKTSEARLNYKVDWQSFLNNVDNIVSAEATAIFLGNATALAPQNVSGCRIAASLISGGVSHVIWVSAGRNLSPYRISSKIWTSGGIRNDDYFVLNIIDPPLTP